MLTHCHISSLSLRLQISPWMTAASALLPLDYDGERPLRSESPRHSARDPRHKYPPMSHTTPALTSPSLPSRTSPLSHLPASSSSSSSILSSCCSAAAPLSASLPAASLSRSSYSFLATLRSTSRVCSLHILSRSLRNSRIGLTPCCTLSRVRTFTVASSSSLAPTTRM